MIRWWQWNLAGWVMLAVRVIAPRQRRDPVAVLALTFFVIGIGTSLIEPVRDER